VEELSARVETLGPLLGELLPEVVAVDLPQQIPLGGLHARGRQLRADAVLERGLQDVLPDLRRLLRLHFPFVVGDAREGYARPPEVAGRRALVFRLVAGVLR